MERPVLIKASHDAKFETQLERIDMHRLAASAAVALAWLTVAACRLPCDSQLRLLPVFAPRFKHCDCSYSEWTEWAPIKSTPVPRSQCSSGKVLTEERRQRVLSGKNCKEKRQEKMLCKLRIMLHISARTYFCIRNKKQNNNSNKARQIRTGLAAGHLVLTLAHAREGYCYRCGCGCVNKFSPEPWLLNIKTWGYNHGSSIRETHFPGGHMLIRWCALIRYLYSWRKRSTELALGRQVGGNYGSRVA